MTETLPRSRSLNPTWFWIRLASMATVLTVAFFFVVGTFSEGIRPPCVHAAQGLSCPTCGLTRSVSSTIQGNLSRAREFHDAGPSLVLFLAVFLLLRPLPFLIPRPWLIATDALAFLLGWALILLHSF